jgi:hypothetical protein
MFPNFVADCKRGVLQDVCHDLEHHAIDRGSEADMEKVFAMIQICPLFKRMGKKCKMGRWASWFKA